MKSVASFVGGAASVGLIVVLAGVPGMDDHRAFEQEGQHVPSPFGTATEPATYTYSPIDPAAEPVQPIPSDVEALFAELGVEHVPARIELGRALFHDARLSSEGTLSCASCHDLRYGGVDRAITATGPDGTVGSINTPTVYNVALHAAHYWDGRAADLEQQARGGADPTGPMAIDWQAVSERLAEDVELMELLCRAYPDVSLGDGVPPILWIRALGDFQRSLTTPGAPFDRYLLGDDTAIDETAKEGYQLFKDLGCAECHDGAAVGGGRLEVLGRARAYPGLDANGVDLGHFNVTGRSEDRHRFKVPSLRNVALTAPYFHDGSIGTLEDAVREMGEHQLDVTLTRGEVARLVAFLGTLTGEHDGRSLGGLQNTTANPVR